MASQTALIVGSTGIAGRNLADFLAREGWTVFGLARKPAAHEDVRPVPADLLNPASLAAALEDVELTHVFITT